MNAEVLRRTVVITNPDGFHVRPQKAFVALAKRFASTVSLCKGDLRVDGKEPWDVMLLSNSPQGSELVLEACGSDAEKALEALSKQLALPSIDVA